MLAGTLSWGLLCPIPELTPQGQGWVPGWEKVDSRYHQVGFPSNGEGDGSSLGSITRTGTEHS